MAQIYFMLYTWTSSSNPIVSVAQFRFILSSPRWEKIECSSHTRLFSLFEQRSAFTGVGKIFRLGFRQLLRVQIVESSWGFYVISILTICQGNPLTQFLSSIIDNRWILFYLNFYEFCLENSFYWYVVSEISLSKNTILM